MPAPRIRADHEALKRLSQSFNQQAEAVRRLRQQLQEKMSVLQNGDWLGKGAAKFYKEMDSQVLPAIQRLGAALASSAQTTQKISQIMKQAEDECARLFRAVEGGTVGVAGGAGGAAPGLAAFVGGFGSVASGVGVGSAGSGAGAGSAASQGARGAAGGATGAGTGTGVPFQGALFANLPPDVQKIAEKSPTLIYDLRHLQADGWTIVVMPRKSGSSIDPHPQDSQGNLTMPETTNGADTFPHHKVIRIYEDANSTPEWYVVEIAHEVGHAKDNPQFGRPDEAGMTRAKYVKSNLKRGLESEAEAVYNELRVADEIIQNGGPDIGSSDPTNYQKHVTDFETLTHDQAIPRINKRYDKATGQTAGIRAHFEDNWKLYKKTGEVNTWN